jgi:methylated-DNA-[protein]-cysteine S-methyltransferase
MNSATYYYSPLGWIEIQSVNETISSVIFCDVPNSNDEHESSTLQLECVRQLKEYFNGQLTNFDLPICQKGTPFQQSVWNILKNIPFGKTVCYSEIAKMLNRPKSARAVGAAVGQNKVWIIVPCHRVIGADGSLRGFAGGIANKKWLLEHEWEKTFKRWLPIANDKNESGKKI